MHTDLLELLRCPFCGTALTLVENDALVRRGDEIDAGVIGCECCAFPIVAGIPVMVADTATREAMHALEAGRPEDALFMLLGLDGERAGNFRSLLGRGRFTYRDAIAVLSTDEEGTYFVYRFSDPTFIAAEALLRAIGSHPWTLSGHVLDLCGGSGHLTRVLGGLPRAHAAEPVINADIAFWKLWLAKRFTAPACAPVCCDANNPLPFDRGGFSLVVLPDAFPYIWQKRLLAAEMMRLVGDRGVVVMPHLHSALGDNFTAGMPLTPAAYLNLFAPLSPRMFSDGRVFEDAIERGVVALEQSVSVERIGSEPAIALVATTRADLYTAHQLPAATAMAGELRVNPLYRVERQGASSVLTLTFPTPEYEEEFAACKRYLPPRVTIDAVITEGVDPAVIGPELVELRRRRVLLDVPVGYV